MQRTARMKRELQQLEQSPPHGVSCWMKNDSIEQLEAQIVGPTGTPYEGGIFQLEIDVPERYPFEPPKIRFVTPVYHPNIDNAGRICLDSLKMPPKGAWKPALNISTLLTSIHLLLSEANPDDPLMTDIATEFQSNRQLFEKHAREWTDKYAPSQSQDKENQPPKEKTEINDKASTSDNIFTSNKASTSNEMSGKHTHAEQQTHAKKIKLG
ncbi:hypothetical protein NP493_376g03021 [Ridgeia piscesae]|uniref:Ubiquitin-conjugating enzyme E2 T n=1 Tax=Ridgeia piscesae TaxID=27915 RepID=A0AAD9L2B0_RIDPI|nr:hypothetical protein NP493_376g03021 [Ridgeia piscesae]